VIEVDPKYGNLFMIVFRLRNGMLQAVVEQEAVGQAGQGIVLRMKGELLVKFIALNGEGGEVRQLHEDAGGSSSAVVVRPENGKQAADSSLPVQQRHEFGQTSVLSGPLANAIFERIAALRGYFIVDIEDKVGSDRVQAIGQARAGVAGKGIVIGDPDSGAGGVITIPREHGDGPEYSGQRRMAAYHFED
jgi:hypothetical protein